MIRARFTVNPDDPRPIFWPLNHPYWVTGYGFNTETFEKIHATIVAYADSVAEIVKLWPDAQDIEFDQAHAYTFTDRFPCPEWFKDAAPVKRASL